MTSQTSETRPTVARLSDDAVAKLREFAVALATAQTALHGFLAAIEASDTSTGNPAGGVPGITVSDFGPLTLGPGGGAPSAGTSSAMGGPGRKQSSE